MSTVIQLRMTHQEKEHKAIQNRLQAQKNVMSDKKQE